MRDAGAPSGRRALLAVGAIFATIATLALLAIGGFALWLARADLRPFIEQQASDALGRQVRVGGFELAWGDPLEVELSDLSIANAPWGSAAELARLGRLSARIDVAALLRGELRYERLRITNLEVALERDTDGTGNWKFGNWKLGGSRSSEAEGGLALVPKNRSQFPILIDFAGKRGLITYRTRSGNLLRIELDRVTIAAPDIYSPVTLQATGTYNGVAARLSATTDPYLLLHDAAMPFGARFAILGNHTDIGFEGSMMEPLDFDGVRGTLSLTARALDDLLAVAGTPRKVDLPLLVVGRLARDGDYWALRNARGRLLRAGFTGKLDLLEGKVAGSVSAPDDLALDLDFALFEADPILAAFGGPGEGELGALPLHLPGLSALNLTATLSTELLRIAGLRLPAFALDGRLEDGRLDLRDLKFLFGGGTLAFDGSLHGDGARGDLQLNAHLIRAEAGQIAAMLGGDHEVRGRINGRATLHLRGATLDQGLPHSSGAALVTLTRGDIARSLVERVSADLRSLFRIEAGRVPVRCLLAAMSVKDGIGTLSPLRLESDEAVLLGGGIVDLARQRLDLTLQTDGDTTGVFALDLPVRVSGPFDDLAAATDLSADRHWIAAAEDGTAGAELPKSLRDLAQASACGQ